jgi:hypothetical protein
VARQRAEEHERLRQAELQRLRFDSGAFQADALVSPQALREKRQRADQLSKLFSLPTPAFDLPPEPNYSSDD